MVTSPFLASNLIPTFCNCVSVIVSPWYKLFRWGLTSLPSNSSFGTLFVAALNISATSNKSLQKPWMEYSLESANCFWKRDLTFSVSANARLYLSWDFIRGKKIKQFDHFDTKQHYIPWNKFMIIITHYTY